jgi:hypothetical protein
VAKDIRCEAALVEAFKRSAATERYWLHVEMRRLLWAIRRSEAICRDYHVHDCGCKGLAAVSSGARKRVDTLRRLLAITERILPRLVVA